MTIYDSLVGWGTWEQFYGNKNKIRSLNSPSLMQTPCGTFYANWRPGDLQ